MELIERYVHEVGRRLPKSQRDEVRRELRSSLLDAVESSEGEPSEAAVIAALRQLGPPATVAASYRPEGQYLIGPELYPHFKRVLSVVLAVLLWLLVGAFAVSIFAGPVETGELGGRLLGFVGGLFDVLWVVLANVVVIFAVLQRLDVKPEREAPEWDPRKLPAVDDLDLVRRGEAAFGLVVAGTFLALLYVFRDTIGIVVNPGGQVLLNDVLIRHLPWISASLVLGMALKAYLFWRGRWESSTRIADFAIDLFGLIVLYKVVAAVAAARPALEAAPLPPPLPRIIVLLAWTGFAIVAALFALDHVKVVYRSLRRSTRPDAQSPARRAL